MSTPTNSDSGAGTPAAKAAVTGETDLDKVKPAPAAPPAKNKTGWECEDLA
jgi:hypothetical protein